MWETIVKIFKRVLVILLVCNEIHLKIRDSILIFQTLKTQSVRYNFRWIWTETKWKHLALILVMITNLLHHRIQMKMTNLCHLHNESLIWIFLSNKNIFLPLRGRNHRQQRILLVLNKIYTCISLSIWTPILCHKHAAQYKIRTLFLNCMIVRLFPDKWHMLNKPKTLIYHFLETDNDKEWSIQTQIKNFH